VRRRSSAAWRTLVVVVTKFDRLGRSTRELLDLVNRISKGRGSFRSRWATRHETLEARRVRWCPVLAENRRAISAGLGVSEPEIPPPPQTPSVQATRPGDDARQHACPDYRCPGWINDGQSGVSLTGSTVAARRCRNLRIRVGQRDLPNVRGCACSPPEDPTNGTSRTLSNVKQITPIM
jgi:hypothetical protein